MEGGKIMNKYEVTVFRVVETEWDTQTIKCEPLFYTYADSVAKAINNVRFRVKKQLGWRNHDENHGSVAVRYEFEAQIVNDQPKYEQLKLFEI